MKDKDERFDWGAHFDAVLKAHKVTWQSVDLPKGTISSCKRVNRWGLHQGQKIADAVGLPLWQVLQPVQGGVVSLNSSASELTLMDIRIILLRMERELAERR